MGVAIIHPVIIGRLGRVGSQWRDRPSWIPTISKGRFVMTTRHRSARPRVSIVVPARNEARNLWVVLPKLPQDAEIIVVDGHSNDDTMGVARRVRPDAQVLQQTRRGKGNALAVGFAAATGDIIVMFDADGSADPAEIDRFVDTLRSGADFAKGSRVMPGGSSADITLHRDLGNRVLTWLTNIGFRTGYSDLCYGYNAFWADVLPYLDLPDPASTDPAMVWGDGFEIETMINCRVAATGLDVVEVPSIELERQFGQSNLHAVRDGLRVLKTIRREWVRARGIPKMDDDARARRRLTRGHYLTPPGRRPAPRFEEAS